MIGSHTYPAIPVVPPPPSPLPLPVPVSINRRGSLARTKSARVRACLCECMLFLHSRPNPAVASCLTGLASFPTGTQPPLASRALRIMRAGPLNIPPAGAAGAFLGVACRGAGKPRWRRVTTYQGFAYHQESRKLW